MERHGIRVEGQESYCRLFTESLEDLLNYAYHRKAMQGKSTAEQDFHGDTAPMSADALNKVGTAYKVYSAIYPALRAWTMLDHLIPFSPGIHDDRVGKEGRLTCAASWAWRGRGPWPRPRSAGCATPSRHRGPDDSGRFVEGGVGLGMRRLSIIDLAGGHQPIANEDGSVVVVFNGEIYNHESLRRELVAGGPPVPDPVATPRSWSTSTRTTASGCSQRLRGMFAFAIWDRRRRRLLVARDRFGEKPLFYTERGGRLDLRVRDQGAARATIPAWPTLSPFALDQYLTLRFVQAPDTFFRIRALPPAHFLVREAGETRVQRYWDLSYGPKWPTPRPTPWSASTSSWPKRWRCT